MKKLVFIFGFLLVACVPISRPDDISTVVETTHQRPITSTIDGMKWNVYQNSSLGFAFDYPENIWDESIKIAKKTYIEEISLSAAASQDYMEIEIGDQMPLQSTAIILGIQDSGPEFTFYADNVKDENAVQELIKKRFGSTCRIDLHSIDSDLNYVNIQWGEGEDLRTRKCLVPNVANRIIFSKTHAKMLSLFKGQEIRFRSRGAIEDPDYRGYDGFISRSLRFIDSTETGPARPAISSTSQPQVAENNDNIALPVGWTYHQINELPFTLALPKEAIIRNRSTKYRGHDVIGVEINSSSTENDPAIWAHKSDFFSFMMGKLSGYNSTEEFLESICLPEGRSPDKQYYRITDQWKQAGMEFTTVSGWYCDPPFAAFGSGVIFGNGANLYLIFLPPGDWGSEGGKYFDIALHSIRPSED